MQSARCADRCPRALRRTRVRVRDLRSFRGPRVPESRLSPFARRRALHFNCFLPIASSRLAADHKRPALRPEPERRDDRRPGEQVRKPGSRIQKGGALDGTSTTTGSRVAATIRSALRSAESSRSIRISTPRPARAAGRGTPGWTPIPRRRYGGANAAAGCRGSRGPPRIQNRSTRRSRR